MFVTGDWVLFEEMLQLVDTNEHHKRVYWELYRCLYSRNIKNLFMAGRNISVTKTGLGPVRVQGNRFKMS